MRQTSMEKNPHSNETNFKTIEMNVQLRETKVQNFETLKKLFQHMIGYIV